MRLHSDNAIFNQVVKIIRILEKSCGAYNLMVDDIPIWWFVRIEFYRYLANYLSNKRIFGEKNNRYNLRLVFRRFIKYIIFLDRAMVSLLRMQKYHNFKKGTIFFTSAGNFRKISNKREDVYFERIWENTSYNKYITVERPTLMKWDLHSLIFRGKIQFFLMVQCYYP